MSKGRVILSFLAVFSFFLLDPYLAIKEGAASEAEAIEGLDSSSLEIKPSDSCKALLLMDAQSGEVIAEFNAHQSLPPASMVKMMTAYLANKRIADQVVSPSDVITVSAAVSKIGGSQVYLKHREQFTLEQMIETVMIKSANDGAQAIAEFLGGSAKGFVDMMNIEAKRLGMNDTEFHSAHGLPPGRGEKSDLTSASDLAILARTLIKEAPELLTLSAKPEAMFRDGSFKMVNTNKLIHTFKGVDGIKTGYYFKAGFSVTATAERNGVRMIAVVMGCKNGRERFNEAARLLSLGFSKYKVVDLIKAGDPAPAAVLVRWGKPQWLVPVAAQGVGVSLRIGAESAVETKMIANPNLHAPLEKGASCGKLIYSHNGKTIGETNLVSPADVPELGLFGKGLRLLEVK